MGRQPKLGTQGVHLQKFEEVVGDLLRELNDHPSFYSLPSLPDVGTISMIHNNVQSVRHFQTPNIINLDKWPFDVLPRSQKGALTGLKAERKFGQLRSIIRCVLSMIPLEILCNTDQQDKRRLRIVDFAGGSGHLALPLAYLLPQVDVVIVDLKAASLELALLKAEEMCNGIVNEVSSVNDNLYVQSHEISNNNSEKKRPKPPSGLGSRDVDITQHDNVLRKCQSLQNLYTFHGTISSFSDLNSHFDIGIGLHACGEASDLILRACGKAKSNFIVSPCCVGKVSSHKKNSYDYWSSDNNSKIQYPQSNVFSSIIKNGDDFDALAKAADYSDMSDMRTNRNATRRTAKALLEFDRILYMKDKFEYDEVVLTRMEPWESSCKNDVLLGWMNGRQYLKGPYETTGGVCTMTPNVDCNTDLILSTNQLLFESTSSEMNMASTLWGEEDEAIIQETIENFLKQEDRTFTFPKGMGREKRKLIRLIAERNDLRHWGIGKINRDKTVVISKKREYEKKN